MPVLHWTLFNDRSHFQIRLTLEYFSCDTRSFICLYLFFRSDSAEDPSISNSSLISSLQSFAHHRGVAPLSFPSLLSRFLSLKTHSSMFPLSITFVLRPRRPLNVIRAPALDVVIRFFSLLYPRLQSAGALFVVLAARNLFVFKCWINEPHIAWMFSTRILFTVCPLIEV